MAKNWYNFRDYQTALQEAIHHTPAVVVIEGEEEYLRHEAIETLQKELLRKKPDIAQVQFFGPSVQGESNVDFSSLLIELTSSSLFASEKIITFKAAQRTLFGNTGSSETAGSSKISPIQSLTNYINEPRESNYLLLEVEKINKQRIIGKALTKAFIIPCPVLSRENDVIQWMKSIAGKNGKNLETTAAITLYKAHGSDLGILASELEKLSLYTGSNQIIDNQAVEVFLCGSLEFSIFELINALEKRDLGTALHFCRLISRQGSKDKNGKKQDGDSSAHQAIALVSSLMENITQARALLAEQLNPAEITAELGMHPRRAENMLAAAGKFTLGELSHILSTIAQAIKSTHDTGGDPKLALERIVVTICQKKQL